MNKTCNRKNEFKGIIFLPAPSRYMVRKYGFDEAIKIKIANYIKKHSKADGK